MAFMTMSKHTFSKKSTDKKFDLNDACLSIVISYQ